MATLDQIASFQLDDLASQVKAEAPVLSNFLLRLFVAGNEKSGLQGVLRHEIVGENKGARFLEDKEEFWSQVDDLEGIIEGIIGTCTTRAEHLASHPSTITRLVSMASK